MGFCSKALKIKGIVASSSDLNKRVFVVGRNISRPPVFHLMGDGTTSVCNQVEMPDFDWDPRMKTGWLSRRGG
jgi:hypothetical protein